MRRRFAIYLISHVVGFLILLFLLLNLLGVVNLVSVQLERVMDTELENSVFQIERDLDELAAYALAMSEQITAETERFLYRKDIDFRELNNNVEMLSELQLENYNIVYNYMHLAECSGAFYFLDTTVNDSLPEEYYNGLYLKLTNLYSESVASRETAMYYGAASVAMETGSDMYTTWQFELEKDIFPEIEEIIGAAEIHDDSEYWVTAVHSLPDTWENARLLCVPVFDRIGQCVGVCGFEMSDQYFQLLYKAGDAEQENLVFGLFSGNGMEYTGQIAGSRSGYSPATIGMVRIEPGRRFDSFITDSGEFLGKRIAFNVGKNELTAAILLPEEAYQTMTRYEKLKAYSMLAGFLLLVIVSGIILSERYVEPLRHGLEQLKATRDEQEFQSKLPEINDLFRFLSEKDREREREQDRERQRLEQIQADMQVEYDRVQEQLTRLGEQRRKEIDPDSYHLFRESLKTLTPKEKEVFSLYLQGKSSKEIIALMEFGENALKYHNKNIYSKLGIASRKELLMYATLMEQEKKNGIL